MLFVTNLLGNGQCAGFEHTLRVSFSISVRYQGGRKRSKSDKEPIVSRTKKKLQLLSCIPINKHA